MNVFVRIVSALTAAIVLSSTAVQPTAAQDLPFTIAAPSPTGSYLAGMEALEDLRTADAARYFLDAAEGDWSNRDVVERAFVALAADGRIEDAESLARHVLELNATNPLAHLALGTVALKERRYASAIKELDAIGAESFIGITAAIVKGWAYVGQGDFPAAEAVLGQFSAAGLDEFMLFHRALMAEVAGRRETAIELVAEAQEADPLIARVVETRARMLGNAGRFDEAMAVIAEFESQGLSHPLVSEVGQAVAAKMRPGMLAPTVQAGAAEMFYGIGTALSRDGSEDLAIVFLQLARYLEPRQDIFVVALALLYEGAGQYELANQLYKELPKDSAMWPLAMVSAAENLDSMGDREEAIRRLRNISVTQPQNLDAISVLGDLLRYDEQYAEAAEVYTRAIEIAGGNRPADWRFFYVRGIAYERAGEWDKAEADFLRALELNPGQPQVLNYLGYSWVDKGMHLNRALEMIEQAVNASPNDGYIVDSLGWAFYKLGRIEEAVQVLEQAVQLRPNDPEINDHLGDAYWRAGRKLEARFQWNIAADVDEAGNVRERVAPKLENGLDVVNGG